MKVVIHILLVCLVLTILSCGKEEAREATSDRAETEAKGEEMAEEKETVAKVEKAVRVTKIATDAVKSLDQYPSRDLYRPFGNEAVEGQAGYGIYYVSAKVRLTLLPPEREILKIDYELPPHFSWGNWMSVRREFTSVMDLGAFDGIELEIEVQRPPDVFFRLTLCDVDEATDFHIHGSDEMWWFDLKNTGVTESAGWLTVRAPFGGFTLSYGAGTRQNDRELDPSKIVAYEFNVVSESDENRAGTVLVKSIRPYND